MKEGIAEEVSREVQVSAKTEERKGVRKETHRTRKRSMNRE